MKKSKEKKSSNKKGKAGVVIVIILLILIVAAILLAKGFGFGGGKGDGDGDGENSTASETVSQEAVDANAEMSNTDDPGTTYFDVTVTADGYIHDSRQYTLDEIKNEISMKHADFQTNAAPDEQLLVRIFDQEASQNLYSDLIAAIEAEGVSYTEAE